MKRKSVLCIILCILMAIAAAGCAPKPGQSGSTTNGGTDSAALLPQQTVAIPQESAPEESAPQYTLPPAPEETVEPAEEATPGNAPEETAEPSRAAGLDWLDFAGKAMEPEEIASMLGETYRDGEGLAGGGSDATYTCRDTSFRLLQTDGARLVVEVAQRSAASPVSIGGASVGMDAVQAQGALEAAGYAQNMDIWNGNANLYFEKTDAQGVLCFVELQISGDTVAQARGLWGAAAEEERASLA